MLHNENVEALQARLEQCRPQQEEIVIAFGRSYDKKAQAVSILIDLGLSLSEEQAARMEQNKGFPAQSLTDAQKALLSRAEPLMRELGFLSTDMTLAESTLLFSSSGHLDFSWRDTSGNQRILGINWLPYSQLHQRDESFDEAQQRCRDRREKIICQHYADFRQAADCCRLLFLLALSLSREQIEQQAAPNSLPTAALPPDLRLLLEGAVMLFPTPLPGNLRDFSLRFEPTGQFWLLREVEGRTSSHGMGWLPYAWPW
jgi:hypothetical protein